MEFKNTFEILTKDIQDIEKLVGNLRNSGEGSTIELDLALSKLRNVYEILTLIREDRAGSVKRSGPSPESPMQGNEQRTFTPQDRRGIGPQAGGEVQSQAEAGVPPQTETGVPPGAEKGPGQESGSGSPLPEKSGESEDTDTAPAPPSILAEKFSASSSINDNMAGSREKKPESKYLGKPIDSISRNIGINDRFLIIREMFDGDADRFSQLVRRLDEAGNYGEADRLLDEAFSGNREHEGAEILESLVKRRYTMK